MKFKRQGSSSVGLARAALATIVAVGIGGSAQAELEAVGEAFTANTYTTSSQMRPDVAMTADGSFVVVWSSYRSTATDPSPPSVQVRSFASDGTPSGPEVQVNLSTTFNQSVPTVAALADGGFVVVWTGEGQGRLLDAAGMPVGAELEIAVEHDIGMPHVDAAPDGGFRVVWAEFFFDGAVKGRRYGSDGLPIGAEFVVAFADPYIANNYPVVEHAGDGSALVAWTELVQAPGNEKLTLRAQSYSSAGMPTGGTFEIASAELYPGEVSQVDLAPSDDGFVAVWTSAGVNPDDTDHRSVEARTVGLDGSLGPRFTVNQTTAKTQGYPNIASVAGGFVVVWSDFDFSVPTGRVAARELDAQGVPLASEIIFGDPPVLQTFPRIDSAGSNDVVMAWNTWHADDFDGSDSAVRARRGAVVDSCTDGDGDGFSVEGGDCGPVDCDDVDPLVNPGAVEIPGNGVDDDCDPSTPTACNSEP